MTQSISAARWCAVHKLQTIRDRYSSGSFEFDVADHAIDLVLSPDRPDNEFLVHNAMRDARSVLIRQKRRVADRGMHPLYGDDEEISPQVQKDQTYARSQPPSVEAVLGWRQEFEQLRARVANDNGYAGRVLDRWLVGDEVNETAQLLKISAHYVKKLRKRIRETAHHNVLEQRVA
jgi:hypothetical protein